MPLKALQTVGQRSVAVVLRFAVKDVPSINGDVEGDFTQINKTKKLCGNNKKTQHFLSHQPHINRKSQPTSPAYFNKSTKKITYKSLSGRVVPSTTPGRRLPNHVQPNVLPNPGIQWPANGMRVPSMGPKGGLLALIFKVKCLHFK